MEEKNNLKHYHIKLENKKHFEELINLKYDIQGLASIVQNEMIIDENMLHEWRENVNNFYTKFKNITKNIDLSIINNEIEEDLNKF